MTGGGFVCSRVPSQTLVVQNGSVSGGSGVSVSGQVEPSGSLSLALQKGGIRGSAVRQAVGGEGLRQLDRALDGMLGPMDGPAAVDRQRSNELNAVQRLGVSKASVS